MSVVIEEDYSGFDWDSTEGKAGYKPLPEGSYPVRIVKADLVTVDGHEGTFRKLAVRLQVLEGSPYAGRLIFDDIILNDKAGSKQRRAIIWRRLGLIEKGAQRASISETDLVGKCCEVEVEVEQYTKRDGTPGAKNKVLFEGYHPLKKAEGAVPQEPGGAAASGEQLTEDGCPF